MGSSIHWDRVQLPEIGVHADVVAGVPLRRTPAEGGGGVVTQYGPAVWLGFARGPDATLAAFARGLEVGRVRVQLGPEEATTLCGRAARRLVAQRTDEGGEAAHGGQLQQVPATTRTYVAVATEFDGTWTRAVWIVDAAARDRLAADEQHFFAAITSP